MLIVELLDHVVQLTRFWNLYLKGMAVDEGRPGKPLKHRRPADIVAKIKYKCFALEALEQGSHAGIFDNLTLVDNRDVMAHSFGFFQVMSGQDDSGALLVDLVHEFPH